MAGKQFVAFTALMLGLAGIAIPAYAQNKEPGQNPPPQRPDGGRRGGPQGGAMAERLKEDLLKLDLSADQKSQIEKIFADAKTQAEALRQDKTVEQKDRMEKMRTIMQETREKALAVLTPEQKQKAQEMMRQHMMQNGGPLERLQEAVKELGLSDDQKTKIASILSDARKEFQAAREKEQGAGQEGREAMMKLLKETRDKVNQVLTPEQSQKLANMIEERRGDRPGAGDRGGDQPGPREGGRRGNRGANK